MCQRQRGRYARVDFPPVFPIHSPLAVKGNLFYLLALNPLSVYSSMDEYSYFHLFVTIKTLSSVYTRGMHLLSKKFHPQGSPRSPFFLYSFVEG